MLNDPLPLPPHVHESPVGRVHDLDGQRGRFFRVQLDLDVEPAQRIEILAQLEGAALDLDLVTQSRGLAVGDDPHARDRAVGIDPDDEADRAAVAAGCDDVEDDGDNFPVPPRPVRGQRFGAAQQLGVGQLDRVREHVVVVGRGRQHLGIAVEQRLLLMVFRQIRTPESTPKRPFLRQEWLAAWFKTYQELISRWQRSAIKEARKSGWICRSLQG